MAPRTPPPSTRPGPGTQPVMQELVEEIRYPGRTELVSKHAQGEVG